MTGRNDSARLPRIKRCARARQRACFAYSLCCIPRAGAGLFAFTSNLFNARHGTPGAINGRGVLLYHTCHTLISCWVSPASRMLSSGNSHAVTIPHEHHGI